MINLLDNNLSLILGISIPVGVILLLGIVFLIIFLVKRKNKREVKQKIVVNDNDLIASLGGKENYVSSSLNMSRLTIVLKDYSIVNKEQLKKQGVEKIVEMSTKMILVGSTVENIYKSLNK